MATTKVERFGTTRTEGRRKRRPAALRSWAQSMTFGPVAARRSGRRTGART